jgi:sugar (pentulose or hexulose) kinase
LCGSYSTSDYSNALKLGYEADRGAWNEAVKLAGVPEAILPDVVAPGCRVGLLAEAAAEDTGLPAGTPVFAGATDGIASLIASGARNPGDANTTLGTTLVWKALSRNRPAAVPGVYSHLHPSGLWAPGAASNTGPGAIQSASALPMAELDVRCAGQLPTPVICYLLGGAGERFPFCRADARPFREGTPKCAEEWHAAQLQAVAFVERWGYETLENCGVPRSEAVFSTGAASRSAVLSGVRASVLNRTVLRCREPGAAFGAAIIAAAGAWFGGDFPSAIAAMTRIEAEYRPDDDLVERYAAIYGTFREACGRRGLGV